MTHRFLIPVKFPEYHSTGEGGEDYPEVTTTIGGVAQQARR